MPKTKGSNLQTIRQANQASVMWALFTRGTMSRIELAGTLGLSAAAISILAKEMREGGLLVEAGIRGVKYGRPEALLDIAYDNFAAVNVNVESDYTHISLCHLNGTVKKQCVKTEELGSDIARELAVRIKKLTAGRSEKILGIGVGIIGAVDEKQGVIVNSYGVTACGYPLADILKEESGLDVYVINNVTAHARAVISDTRQNFLYVKHGAGVGCAIVNNGKPVRGAGNVAGEIGHTIAEEGGALCRCGKRGCLELFVYEPNIVAEYAKTGNSKTITQLYEDYGKDAIAKDVLTRAAHKLAVALVNAAALIDPKEIIVQGGMFEYREILADLCTLAEKLAGKPFSIIKLDKATEIKYMANARLVFDKTILRSGL